jgi:hypothetical protein
MIDRQFETIQIPGRSQALSRAETVLIVVDEQRPAGAQLRHADRS